LHTNHTADGLTVDGPKMGTLAIHFCVQTMATILFLDIERKRQAWVIEVVDQGRTVSRDKYFNMMV